MAFYIFIMCIYVNLPFYFLRVLLIYGDYGHV